ncbi:hypothetical protein [Amycolatopsis sp.]|uniref:hypothetical protein n=1 Tax=Amycolatopsis sp. TaxID=37632 RepID=UPI002CE4F1B1|nr:hypothetical protein [Amycolatopsis sp.]HVV11603.1 hypothetical protein [Amycolatopsis sp.]
MNREDAAESAPWLLPADDPRHECNFRGNGVCDGPDCNEVCKEWENPDRGWWNEHGHLSSCPVWGDEEMIGVCLCGPPLRDVWMQVPGSKQGGWSKVAAAVHKGEADVWERTSLHKIHTEESKP